MLDPTYAINTIVNDSNVGALSAVGVPMIENSQFDIDFSTLEVQPSGAQRYTGVMPKTRKPVEVLIYPNDYLSFVSADGKAYSRHLQLELQVASVSPRLAPRLAAAAVPHCLPKLFRRRLIFLDTRHPLARR